MGNSIENKLLFGACKNNDIKKIKELVEEKGDDINEQNVYGWTVLHVASMYGHLETVKYLVEKGANINEKHKYGWTALHFASRNGHLETVKYLVGKDADLCLKTTSKNYAFDFINDDESLKTLMENKMKIQKFQKFQYTNILRFNRLLMSQVNKNIYKRLLFELILGYINEIK